jgi:D-3-phosphoglycerate dehydrogenase
MSFRVFHTGSGISEEAQEFLKNEGCSLMRGDPVDSAADIARKVRDFSADALIVRQGEINDDVIAASDNLRVICKHGTGTDNIDIDAATRRNVLVMYTPYATVESAAEHTLGLILSLLRQIPDQDKKVRSGDFAKRGFRGQELRGKTLGLVGFGRIARRLSELVAPFNVKVIVNHPSNSEENLATHVSKVLSLAELLCQSDIVSMHVPLTDTTRAMMDREAFVLMKPSAYLINTARGLVVNESDLIDALTTGQIKGAALDTYEIEPPGSDNPLYQMDNVVLTMHTAGNSDSSLRNMAMGSARNILAVLRDEAVDPDFVLNSQA